MEHVVGFLDIGLGVKNPFPGIGSLDVVDEVEEIQWGKPENDFWYLVPANTLVD